MRLSKCLHRPWGRHDDGRPCGTASRPRTLMVEGLEDRALPSTLTVSNNRDNLVHRREPLLPSES